MVENCDEISGVTRPIILSSNGFSEGDAWLVVVPAIVFAEGEERVSDRASSKSFRPRPETGQNLE